MPNLTNAKKAVRQIERRTLDNQRRKSRVRTMLKRVHAAVEAGDAKTAQTALRQADKEAQMAANKNLFHKKTVSRTISRLSRRVRELSKPAA